MAGSIDGDIQFFLQRREGTGAWTTIATSDKLVVTIADDAGAQTVTNSGQISTTFSAGTLNWSTTAQYRIIVRRDYEDSSPALSVTVAETRVYSVSTA